MFLSDKLIEIGRKSNPKNNVSMNEALHLMNSECKMALKSGDIYERIKTAFVFAVKTLNKEGFSYFKPEQFNL